MKARFRHRINNNEFISHNLAIQKNPQNISELRDIKLQLPFLFIGGK